MSKSSQSSKRKYYAVKVGAEGPRVYDSWDECKENVGHRRFANILSKLKLNQVSRYPGAVHKSFATLRAAQNWLAPALQAYNAAMPVKTEPVEIIEIEDTPPSSPLLRPTQNAPQPKEEPGTPAFPDLGALDATPPKQDVKLSPEQEEILAMVRSIKNVFFTGSAGTGKSVLLKEIIRHFRHDNPHQMLAVTASTGIASVNIGGTTLHSWAGIGLGKEPKEKLAGKIAGNESFNLVARRWRTVKALIIDESKAPTVLVAFHDGYLSISAVSMIDGKLFDKLEYIARYVRMNNAPFGGIQLILSGDFYQLPPVPDNHKGHLSHATFAFDATSWERCMGKPISLTKVFRQKDPEFVDMLNAMRVGKLDPDTIARFSSLSRSVQYDDGIEPTELYPLRREVQTANDTRLKQINAISHGYRAQDWPGRDSQGNPKVNEDEMNRLLDRLVAPKEITLKVGAQVMLVKNMVPGVLVNGTVGKVVDFITYREALQSQTEIAAPREKDEKVVPDFVKSSTIAWPLVVFTNGQPLLCVPADFTVEDAHGEVEATRMQVPLILAWALSVHKSQGQTLERVRVDLKRTFEKGQAYVALSRATNLDTLQVVNFNSSKSVVFPIISNAQVVAHPRVLEWHMELTRHEDYDEYDEYNEGNNIDDAFMDTEEAIASYYTGP
ncbi:hypothetical protein EW146_g7285 [Bondarzewia mesenterica]|uniref:ATP-dependent DNA helicase PIF1 n=1 Tax=Bondarzewia mesenterica TaxID=1095465 RepID=A0A4S4LN17_9AGAM|nr:hypothetical protein EW146_g7285 [Bondarzewia mesenterica]